MHTVKIRVNEKVHDDVSISFCIPPSPTNGGPDQNVYGISTTLAAEAVPANATGTWSIISGAGGSISNASSPTSTFYGAAGITYVLRWTVIRTCGTSSDEVSIKIESVTDIDGNVYGVVKYEDIYFMAENLRTTRYNDGELITNVQDQSI